MYRPLKEKMKFHKSLNLKKQKVIRGVLASLGLVLFFQNCGDVNVENRPSLSAPIVAPLEIKNIGGTICHLDPVSAGSTFRLSSFYILNLTAHKFNGNLEPDNDLDGMVDLGALDSGGETVSVTNIDTDEDGIPDFIEKLKGLNPTSSDADKDGADLDGLINRRELQLGTDPSFSGDKPAIDYTVEPSGSNTGCGANQPAYKFTIQNMTLTGNRAFTDTVNASAYSLSHASGENILMVLAKLSPDDVRQKSLFVVKFFKIDINNPTTPEFIPQDFSVLGEATDDCPDCNDGLTGSIYKKVYASDKHVCALSTLNNIICWGDNAYGQLGDSTNSARVVPIKPKTTEKILTMALGPTHTCAITNNNEVYCWGSNSFGQLGIGSQVDQNIPTKVNLGTTAAPVLIMAGAAHTCVTFDNNTIKCWGRNDLYQLGNGNNTMSTTPVSVTMPAAGVTYPIVHVSAGGHNSCFTSTNGMSFCWGRVSSCTQNSLKKVPASCDNSNPPTFPSEGIRLTNAWAAMETNGAIESGIAKDALGRLTCWGNTIYSQWTWALGCANQEDNGEPQYDEFGNIIGVSSEYSNVVSRVIKVKLGPAHSCAIWNRLVNATTGELRRQLDCWGDNSQGALAQPVTAQPLNETPSTVSEIKEPLDVGAGTDFTCAIDKDGIIWCWGVNSFGQLGSGDIANSSTPAKVKNQ